MTTEIAIENPAKKAPRKRTRRVKEAENANNPPAAAPAADSNAPQAVEVIEPVVEAKPVDAAPPEAAPEPARLSPRPRRVEPDDARAIAAQVDLGKGAREASEAYIVVMPGDLCPGVKEHFWRTVGRAIDRGLPNEVVLPLIGAFEAVLLATSSVAETARRFDQLATDAHTLRRYGHGTPSKKGTEFNALQKELVVEFLAGSSSAFLLGTVEHVRRACPTLSWRLRETVVMHLLGMYRAVRGETAGLPGEREMMTATIGQEIDRLGDERRRLVKAVSEQKASGLDPMLINAWVETDDPKKLVDWVDGAITKKTTSKMEQALAQAHVHIDVPPWHEPEGWRDAITLWCAGHELMER